MKYIDAEDNQDNSINKWFIITIILSIICIILLGYIIIDKLTTEKIDCGDIEEKTTEKIDKDDTKEDEVDKDNEENNIKKPSVENITVDNSYKINPNVTNYEISFDPSSCALMQPIYNEKKIDLTKPYSLTIKNIELNAENHKYRYIIDHNQNINIEVFDGGYISTKDSAFYTLSQVCNYDNHFIVIETPKDSVKSHIKIIDIYGDIKYYAGDFIGINYKDNLLNISFINDDDKYQKIAMNLKKDLEYEVIEEEDVDCTKYNQINPNASDKERELVNYCETSKKS